MTTIEVVGGLLACAASGVGGYRLAVWRDLRRPGTYVSPHGCPVCGASPKQYVGPHEGDVMELRPCGHRVRIEDGKVVPAR